MEKLEMLIDNWELIVVAFCAVILTVQKMIKFLSLPTAAKTAELRAVLLEWVRNAEADLGSKTGRFKLAQVYSKFCETYPELKKWFPLSKFELLVDEVLGEMNMSLNSNPTTKQNALKQQED